MNKLVAVSPRLSADLDSDMWFVITAVCLAASVIIEVLSSFEDEDDDVLENMQEAILGFENSASHVRCAAVIFKLATGQNYFHIGERFGIGSSTVQEMMYNVVLAINRELGGRFMLWPRGQAMKRVSKKFYRKCGLPNIQGAIEGTQIRVRAPKKDTSQYFNRKQFHSLLMQAVCDPDGVFLDISCRMPGHTNDKRVLRRSKFLQKVEMGEILSGPEMVINGGYKLKPYVLGDAGYNASDWLVMPYSLNPHSTSLQHLFSERQIRGRICIEQAFGVLKPRWQSLTVGITSLIQWAAKIVKACCVLHNLLVKCRVESLGRVSDNMEIPPKFSSGSNRLHLGDSGYDVRNQLCEFLALN
ncbi:hypothetical protein R1flu_009601 [Riccia fluitans]|uniref:DDE Tnp4 domain-containing protein n=1 Tax=Riccia fluitans TaxID=41844 RepID=A0ABD1Z2K5_9MARC